MTTESQKASERDLLLEASLWEPLAGGVSDGKVLLISSREGLMVVQKGTLITSGISVRVLDDLLQPHDIMVFTRERLNDMLERAEKNGKAEALEEVGRERVAAAAGLSMSDPPHILKERIREVGKDR